MAILSKQGDEVIHLNAKVVVKIILYFVFC